VRHRQTVLRRQFTELFVGKTHNYWTRIIIKQLGQVSTEIFPSREMNMTLGRDAMLGRGNECVGELKRRHNPRLWRGRIACECSSAPVTAPTAIPPRLPPA
jgi:hypothetical protein